MPVSHSSRMLAGVYGVYDVPVGDRDSKPLAGLMDVAVQNAAGANSKCTGRLNNQVQHLSGRVLQWEPTMSI